MSRPGLRMLLAAVFMTAATGCATNTSPGLSNGSVSSCYRAIPAARHAIHSPSATLVSVHRLSADRVRSHLPPSAQSRLAGDNDTTVCAIAFHGKFAPGQVELAPSRESGSYAVVLITSKKLRLIDGAVLERLPRFLGKRLV